MCYSSQMMCIPPMHPLRVEAVAMSQRLREGHLRDAFSEWRFLVVQSRALADLRERRQVGAMRWALNTWAR